MWVGIKYRSNMIWQILSSESNIMLCIYYIKFYLVSIKVSKYNYIYMINMPWEFQAMISVLYCEYFK